MGVLGPGTTELSARPAQRPAARVPLINIARPGAVNHEGEINSHPCGGCVQVPSRPFMRAWGRGPELGQEGPGEQELGGEESPSPRAYHSCGLTDRVV